MYYIYIIRCEDNSLYTGITKDINKRMNEHFNKLKECAKYTYVHNAIKQEIVWTTSTRVNASKLEYHLKHLTKSQKEDIINNKNMSKYLNNKIDCSLYDIL